jgi:hypothetical protein
MHTVSIFDLKNGANTRVAQVTVGTEPNGVAVSPDGSRIYVANTVSGTITAPMLSPTPLRVEAGRFNLLVRDADTPGTRKMVYAMPAIADDGRTFHVDGFKTIHDDQGLDVWNDTTTLFITVTDLNGAAEKVIAKGILHILPADFLHQMTTMKVTNAASPLEALQGLVAFGAFFAGVLYQTYGGVFVRSNEMRADATRSKRMAMRSSVRATPIYGQVEASSASRLPGSCGEPRKPSRTGVAQACM